MKLFEPFLKVPRWVLTVVCTLLILYLTLVPKPLPDNDIRFWEHTDKLVHAIMFGALFVCGYLDLWRGQRAAARGAWLLAAAVAVLGGVIEIVQQAMAMGRGGSAGDWLADCGGILLAMLLMTWCTRSPRVQRP